MNEQLHSHTEPSLGHHNQGSLEERPGDWDAARDGAAVSSAIGTAGGARRPAAGPFRGVWRLGARRRLRGSGGAASWGRRRDCGDVSGGGVVGSPVS